MDTRFIRQVGFWRWLPRYLRLQVARRVLRRDLAITLPTGARMILPRTSHSAGEVFVTAANIDWGSEALAAALVRPDEDFLDVGAHVGYYAAYLSPRVRRVYAFEPDPRNLGHLRRNAEALPNVEVVPCAVSSREGTARFEQHPSTSVGSLEVTGGGTVLEVPMVTVDGFAAARPGLKVGLVKTDVEGHDLEALRGMARTVARDQPLVVTECEATPALAALAEAWGYRVHAFVRDRETSAVALEPLPADRFAATWHKMLFLVPPRLEAAFAAREGGRDR